MTGDRSKFVTFDENKSGNVTFGNDKAGKIKEERLKMYYLWMAESQSAKCQSNV